MMYRVKRYNVTVFKGSLFVGIGNSDNAIEFDRTLKVRQSPYEKFDENYNTEVYFDETVSKHVLGYVGESVSLRCVIHNLGEKSVMWIRHRDLHILSGNLEMFMLDNRFEVFHVEKFDEWTLHINSIQLNDKGTYECQVPMHPIKSYIIQLDVLEPVNFPNENSLYRREPSHQKSPYPQELFQHMYADQDVTYTAIQSGSTNSSPSKSKYFITYFFYFSYIFKYFRLL